VSSQNVGFESRSHHRALLHEALDGNEAIKGKT